MKVSALILLALIWSTDADAQWFKALLGLKATPTRLSSSDLDIESQRCMSCHDGSRGKIVELRPKGAPLEFDATWRTKNHSIGMNYQTSYDENPNEYVAPSMLHSRIKIIDGKIGCLSCHVAQNDLVASLTGGGSLSNNECTVDIEATQEAFQGSLCIQCHVR